MTPKQIAIETIETLISKYRVEIIALNHSIMEYRKNEPDCYVDDLLQAMERVQLRINELTESLRWLESL